MTNSPIWLNGDSILNNEFGLYIVHFQQETKLLFIYAYKKTETAYEAIVKSFVRKYNTVSKNKMNRVLAGFSSYEFFNTGMQNRYSENGESYRIYAGSNTAISIDENTGKMLSAGHAFCKVNNGGRDSTIGYSSGAKFWSSSYLSIPNYIKWCDCFGEKINNNNLIVKTNTNYDRLPIPTEIVEYERNILFCFLNKKAYMSPCVILNPKNPKEKAFLTDIEIKIKEVYKKKIEFLVSSFGLREILTCDTEGKYRSKKVVFTCKDGKEEFSLAEFFSENPLLFKTANDTVYAGNEVLKSYIELEKYDPNRIYIFDWENMNVDTTLEYGEKNDGTISIQEGLRNVLEKQAKYSHIIFDHGTGEVADYITIEEQDDCIYLEMYHCKAKKGKRHNSAVEDIYEVAQQAIKSSIWVTSRTILIDKLNNRLSKEKNKKFVRGEFNSLIQALKSSKALRVKIYIVQPAISKSAKMSPQVEVVLSAATSFIKNIGRVQELLVIGSE